MLGRSGFSRELSRSARLFAAKAAPASKLKRIKQVLAAVYSAPCVAVYLLDQHTRSDKDPLINYAGQLILQKISIPVVH
jgi:hypothetical protein